MNRQQRRAARIKDPKGNALDVFLAHIIDRDAKGRPTTVRIAYDEETIGDVVGADEKPEMLMIWMHPGAGARS